MTEETRRLQEIEEDRKNRGLLYRTGGRFKKVDEKSAVMKEETALALIAALNRLSVAMDRLVLPDRDLGKQFPDGLAATYLNQLRNQWRP
jgi:hypothetical protein